VGIRKIVCVVGQKHTAWARRNFPGVVVLTNRNPDAGMLSSVKIGVERLKDLKGVLVVPVDHPCVARGTYRRLLCAFAEDADAVVKPTYLGQSGHPVLIPRKLFDRIRRADADTMLNELIRKSKLEQVRVPCNDPGILRNVNTPADMRSASSPLP